MNNNTNGRIELIIGPMYSGKSSELIKIANRYKIINKNILAVNHTLNNRYNTNNISTHDNNILQDCIKIDKLTLLEKDYYSQYKKADIIFIEELQFFTDAYDFVINAADKHNKIIIAAGLNGDFKRNPFDSIVKLIPHADKITKLSALCKYCSDGTFAHFSKLIDNNNSENQILVGGLEKYEAVCRKHYNS